MTRPAMSTRQASQKAVDAADQVLDWLGQQGGLPDGSGGDPADPGHLASGSAETPSPVSPMPPVPAKCEAFAREDPARGPGEAPGPEHDVDRSLTRPAERTDDVALAAAAPLRPAHTDWLHHRLLVAGPAGTLADFQVAACGSGTIPWRLDLDRMEEDLFLMLAAPPPPQRRRLSLAGVRALAGQLRDAAEQRHAAATARVGRSLAETRRQPQTASRFRRVCGRACALDLHALLPVPDSVLRLGPDHPDALDWLWTHWGTTAALRHVAAEPVLPRRAAPDDPVTLRLAFWSADWTPWRALAAAAARWPALRFDVRPTYGLL